MQSVEDLGDPTLAEVMNPARYAEVPLEQLDVGRYYIYRFMLDDMSDILKVKYLGTEEEENEEEEFGDENIYYRFKKIAFRYLGAFGNNEWQDFIDDEEDDNEASMRAGGGAVHFFIPVQNGGKRRGRKARKSRRARKSRKARKTRSSRK